MVFVISVLDLRSEKHVSPPRGHSCLSCPRFSNLEALLLPGAPAALAWQLRKPTAPGGHSACDSPPQGAAKWDKHLEETALPLPWARTSSNQHQGLGQAMPASPSTVLLQGCRTPLLPSPLPPPCTHRAGRKQLNLLPAQNRHLAGKSNSHRDCRVATRRVFASCAYLLHPTRLQTTAALTAQHSSPAWKEANKDGSMQANWLGSN